MSYETTPIGAWNDDNWIEFYRYLETVLNYSPEHGDGREYVPNPNGGFQALYWFCRRWEDNVLHYNDNDVYLQIHSDRRYVTFRVAVREEPGRDDIRNECSNIIGERARERGRREIIAPPPYPRLGKTMAFARVEQEGWLGGSHETIDKVRVVDVLKTYESILEECFVRQ
jgi:hypothetical protein